MTTAGTAGSGVGDALVDASADGGWPTDDVLDRLLPLFRQVAAAHADGFVADLPGLRGVVVDRDGRWGLADDALRHPTESRAEVRRIEETVGYGVEVVGRHLVTTELDSARSEYASADVLGPDGDVDHPVHVPGYRTWEDLLGHHDAAVDAFVLGCLLASLACGVDLTDPEEHRTFVAHREHLFHLQPDVHPVVARTIREMTEVDRHKRSADVAGLVRRLETYRDQPDDFDLSRLDGFGTATQPERRRLILERLRDRLFDPSRRNRLLYFRPTQQTVDLTVASVPQLLDHRRIDPAQLFTWHPAVAAQVTSGKPVRLGSYLRFEEAPYLAGTLDKIISQARRDRAEYGFAQLRLVIAFLRWHDLRGVAEEVIDSPLLLLPVELTKKKGVRDSYVLEPTTSEAEVNPSLRHRLAELYDLRVPDRVDLTTTTVEDVHASLVAQIEASEPAVSLRLVDRPRIDLVQREAKLRVEVFRRRQAAAARRSAASRAGVDHSYRADDYRPLGVQLYARKVRPSPLPQRTAVGAVDTGFRTPEAAPVSAGPTKTVQTYSLRREAVVGNPYEWELDLCRVTLGNFNYRRMSLVQDYNRLLAEDAPPSAFDPVFAVDNRPVDQHAPLPPTAEQHVVVDSDATQLLAVARAAGGESYIVQGPPGTGKSQTITNLIADFAARGKRVLFVCEKRAAVDVVYHRLRQQELDTLCCLIHDSQTDKRAFIADLKQVYEGHLEQGDGDLDSIEDERDAVVRRIDEELDDLRRLSSVLSAAVPGSDRSALALVDHLVELRAAAADGDGGELPGDLEPELDELVPPFADWVAAAPAARRLERALAELGEDPVPAAHPVVRLGPAILQAERPNRTARSLVQRARREVDEVRRRLDTATVPAHLAEDLVGMAALAAAAVSTLGPLTGYGGYDLLDPVSPRAVTWDGVVREHANRRAAAEAAATAAAGWQQPPDPATTAEALDVARRKEGTALASLSGAWRRARRLVEERYRPPAGGPTGVTAALEALATHHRAQSAWAELRDHAAAHYGTPDIDVLATLVDAGRALRRSPHRAVASVASRPSTDPALPGLLSTCAALHEELDALQRSLTELFAADAAPSGTADDVVEALDRLADELDLLPTLVDPLRALADGPPAAARAVRLLPLRPDGIEWAAGNRALDRWLAEDRGVARLDGAAVERRVRTVGDLRRQLLDRNSRLVRGRVRRRFLEHVRVAGLPAAQLDEAGKAFKKAYAAGRRELEHELGKVMRHKSIRDLAAGPAGRVIADLKPVWLMSPLSVSDTLPLDPGLFDVVVFDEASQIPLEEAIPALHRAPHVVVVGDQMQLPPTTFFSAAGDDVDDLTVEEDGETVSLSLDGDSFLNQSASNLPSVLLAWHYRSRYEDLIRFSNAVFYGGELRTIPDRSLDRGAGDITVRAADDGARHAELVLDRPISFHLLEHGVYAERRNQDEAAYIAELVRALLAADTGRSIGIVAFSEAQQGAIEEHLARLAAGDPDFAARLEKETEREEDDQFVGLFVKNLENVQGDERDIVILSICYGPDPTGRMRMSFGPINAKGGEKRLNVIFSRAKHHMAVVSSIRSQAITNDWNDGAAALKGFLRYAEATSGGHRDHAAAVLDGLSAAARRARAGEHSSVVVRELAAALRGRGLVAETDVGSSSLRCDVAVRRPDDTAHRLAVLVDHRLGDADTDATSARRDHERYVDRPRALSAAGWDTTHVLAKDWLRDPDAVTERLVRRVLGGDTGDTGDAVEPAGEPGRVRRRRRPATAAPQPQPRPTEEGQVREGAWDEPPPEPPEPPEPPVPPVAAEPTAPAPARAPVASTTVAPRRHLEYVAGGSAKFWRIAVAGTQVLVTFGRIGTKGQTQLKDFDTVDAAERHADRLIAEKLRKGYQDVVPPPG